VQGPALLVRTGRVLVVGGGGGGGGGGGTKWRDILPTAGQPGQIRYGPSGEVNHRNLDENDWRLRVYYRILLADNSS